MLAHQDPDSQPTFTKTVLELKQLKTVATEKAIAFSLFATFGVDVINGEASTFEANLSELQDLRQVNRTFLSVEMFACGCYCVSLVNKFL